MPTASLRSRVAVALCIGVLALIASHAMLAYFRLGAADFTWPLRAARILLAGGNPYQAIAPTAPYPYDDYFLYPLPAALLVVPFAPLPDMWAAALFVGLSSGLLAFALTRDGWYRLPLFLSVPFIVTLRLGQWSTLVMALALLGPIAQALTLVKPTLGLALFAHRPSRRAALLAVLVLLASLAVLPSWPLGWLNALRHSARYAAPLLAPFGALLLLALLRWRRPEGRLLLALSAMPRYPFWYDALPLWLIPNTLRQSLVFSLLSWAGLAVWRLASNDEAQLMAWQNAALYLPALALALFSKTSVEHEENEGGQEEDRAQRPPALFPL